MNGTCVKLFISLCILALSGCGGGGGDASTAARSDPLATALGADNVSRDPTQFPPNPAERLAMQQQEAAAFAGVQSSNLYPNTLAAIRQRASIASFVPIVVVEDFRQYLQISMVGGGIATHDVIRVDGKFLDILGEYANYLAMRDLGLTSDNAIVAIDKIVLANNATIGTIADSRYPYSGLSAQGKNIADLHFQTLAGAIVYHEFGHYFLYHALDMLRSFGTPIQAFMNYTTLNEDSADIIAGMLSAKAGSDLALAQQMVDLMAFYTLHRMNPGTYFSFATIVGNIPSQYSQSGPTHSALAVRKQNIAEGFNRFNANR